MAFPTLFPMGLSDTSSHGPFRHSSLWAFPTLFPWAFPTLFPILSQVPTAALDVGSVKTNRTLYDIQVLSYSAPPVRTTLLSDEL